MDAPLVSVCIITYNHARYIRRCIESVLAQQTSFAVEIIVGDNASSDGTSEICAALAAEYPGKIIHLLNDRNDLIVINGNATGRSNVLKTLEQARGRYVALLEGDDYWLDMQKLEKQTGFLEAHPDYAICCSNALLVDESDLPHENQPEAPAETSSLVDLAARNFIYTASVMYRSAPLKAALGNDYRLVPAGDYFLHMLVAKTGLIHCFSDRLVAYRLHPEGIWAGKSIVFQRVNLVQTIWQLQQVLNDETEVVAVLEKTKNDHLDFIFHHPEFHAEQVLAKLDNVPFAAYFRNAFHVFRRKQDAFSKPSASRRLVLKIKRLFGKK